MESMSSGRVEKAEGRGPLDQVEKELSKCENQVAHDMKLVFVAGPPYNRS